AQQPPDNGGSTSLRAGIDLEDELSSAKARLVGAAGRESLAACGHVVERAMEKLAFCHLDRVALAISIDALDDERPRHVELNERRGAEERELGSRYARHAAEDRSGARPWRIGGAQHAIAIARHVAALQPAR